MCAAEKGCKVRCGKQDLVIFVSHASFANEGMRECCQFYNNPEQTYSPVIVDLAVTSIVAFSPLKFQGAAALFLWMR